MASGAKVAEAIIGSIVMLAGLWFVLKHKNDLGKIADDFLTNVTTQATAPAAPAPAAAAPPSTPSAAAPPAATTTTPPASSFTPSTSDISTASQEPQPSFTPTYSGGGAPPSSSTPTTVDTSGPPVATPPVDTGGATFPTGHGTLYQQPTPANWFPKSTYVPPAPPAPPAHPASHPSAGTPAHPIPGIPSCVIGNTRYRCDQVPCAVGESAIEGACKFACNWSDVDVTRFKTNCQRVWHPQAPPRTPLHTPGISPATAEALARTIAPVPAPPPPAAAKPATRGPCADGSWPDANGNCKPIPVYMVPKPAGFFYSGDRMLKQKLPRGGYY